MTDASLGPDDIPRVEVRVFDGDEEIAVRQFSTVEAAEAFAATATEETPQHRTTISVVHLHEPDDEAPEPDEEVQDGASLVEDYPHS